ncbi:MAG: hypothetical protein QNL61_11395, partial [Crocinitomicaceae bacterium]
MESTYFSILDIIPVFFWAMVILVVALVVRTSKRHLPEYKYYMPNIFMKMFFACAYGAFYIYVYGGGDTTAFYDAAITLNNLFFKSPALYFEQMITTPNPYQFTTFYDTTTGYPPGWIY